MGIGKMEGDHDSELDDGLELDDDRHIHERAGNGHFEDYNDVIN